MAAITPDAAAAYAASRLEAVAKGLEWADCPLQAGMVRQLAEQLTTFAREVSSAL